MAHRLMFVFLVVFVLAPIPVSAQDFKPDERYRGYPNSLYSFPKGPPDLKACVAGEYYEPLDVHLVRYADRVKVTQIRVQEFDECVWMRTNRGDRYVLRPKGTQVGQDAMGRDLFDFGSPNGMVCKNARPFSVPIIPLQPPAPEILPEKIPEPVAPKPVPLTPAKPTPPPAPESPSSPLPSPPEPPPQVPPRPRVSESQWGVTTSSLVGKYNSSLISALVSNLSGRDVCSLSGRVFDIGFAFGRPDQSFWRLTFAGNFVEDDSYTRYFCPECNMEVINKAEGMEVWGGKLERIQRIGFNGYAVRPMATFNVGLGGVSGESIRTVRTSDGSVFIQRVGARELFGSSAFPIAGVGAGLVGSIGRRFTLGVTIAGIEYPGVYYGRIQVTYWP